MWNWIKSLFTSDNRTTWVYCPECGEDLIGRGDWDGPDGSRLESFTCSNCETRSTWNFDTPAPILKNHGTRTQGSSIKY